jgi:CheY-like chemotaxis protein/signal transduction histidine kinase
MDRLPFTSRILLATSAGTLALSGLALASAALTRQSDMMVFSAAALLAASVGGLVFAIWRVAGHFHETERPRRQVRRHLRLPAMEAPRSRTAMDAPTSSLPEESDAAADEHGFRRAQKLEAFERLRDGIVHDLNNKLMVISANIDSVARQMKDQPALQRKLLSALVASDQAADLIARSTAFARRQQAGIERVDVAEKINSIAALMSRSFLRDTVELRLTVEEGLWSIEVDQDDLETAIVGLSAYARDDIAQGGSITLEARNVHIQKGSLTDISLEGDFVQLVIGSAEGDERIRDQDDGQERAFALRDIDLSAWRRLSRSLQFLKPIGGAAEVRNTGAGTAIILYLPRAKAMPSVMPGSRYDDAADGEAMPRDIEILVVDDEVEVAQALQSMLEETGYVTRIATNAGQVMKSLKTRRPDLVLTDVSMPGTMNGIMLAREIRQIVPELPVLLITGNPAVTEDDGEYPLLQKPIVSRDLHAAIQRHLKPTEENKIVPLFPRASRHKS